jgi:hypothetical protein
VNRSRDERDPVALSIVFVEKFGVPFPSRRAPLKSLPHISSAFWRQSREFRQPKIDKMYRFLA